MKRFFVVRLLALFAILAGLMSAGRVNAQSTSGPFTTSTPISDTATDYTGTLTFPKFQSSLGTLLSVTISITTDVSGTVSIYNSGSTTESGTMFPFVLVGFTDPDNYLPTPFDMYENPTGGSLTATALTKPYAFSGLTTGNTATSGTLSSTLSTVTTFNAVNNPQFLSECTGSSGDSVTLSLSTATGESGSVGGGSGTGFMLSTSVVMGITGTITYTYAP